MLVNLYVVSPPKGNIPDSIGNVPVSRCDTMPIVPGLCSYALEMVPTHVCASFFVCDFWHACVGAHARVTSAAVAPLNDAAEADDDDDAYQFTMTKLQALMGPTLRYLIAGYDQYQSHTSKQTGGKNAKQNAQLGKGNTAAASAKAGAPAGNASGKAATAASNTSSSSHSNDTGDRGGSAGWSIADFEYEYGVEYLPPPAAPSARDAELEAAATRRRRREIRLAETLRQIQKQKQQLAQAHSAQAALR